MKSKEKRHPPKRGHWLSTLSPCLVIPTIFFGLCVSLCLCVIIAAATQDMDSDCHRNSEVYRAIEAHHQEWEDFFPDSYSAQVGNGELTFETADGKTFIVMAEYWTTPSGAPVFFIQTRLGWPATPLSVRGLFYTPTGELPIYAVDEITHLDGNIYCYRIE